ncbi:uncharacterized protein LOC124912483 [Impatiens glandulifera]|uniref:uncharacterized protein LOC124912483 n=1 Tax=Impatiens glandulifera TaxID=253017 RepID=UPI001FB0FEBB|nr:uncharacterized protein LOC124912483 [Impatiens glandulifera]
MFRFTRSPLFHLLIILLCFSPFIRSEEDDGRSSIIRMPVDDHDDICSGTPVQPSSCPVKCFRPDPVCGIDGVTYWCGCAEARCAGIRVEKTGFCLVGNGGSGSLSGQAFLLVHIVWLIVLGFSVLFGLL